MCVVCVHACAVYAHAYLRFFHLFIFSIPRFEVVQLPSGQCSIYVFVIFDAVINIVLFTCFKRFMVLNHYHPTLE